MLNLLQYPDENIPFQTPADRPAWEMEDPFTPDRSQPRGYLDYLTWQNRRILLRPELDVSGTVVRQMTLAPGLRLEGDLLDPMKHYARSKNPKRGYLPLRFSEERALWRDSAALFRLHTEGYHPPQAFEWLSELIGGDLEEHQTRRVMALGLANDQAKSEFYRYERMPLPASYLREQRPVDDLDSALLMAEGAARQLWGAARTLARFLLSPAAGTEEGREPRREDLDQVMGPWGVGRGYWSCLEVPFFIMMEALPIQREQALTAWQTMLRRTAWSAFDRVTEKIGVTPRRQGSRPRANNLRLV